MGEMFAGLLGGAAETAGAVSAEAGAFGVGAAETGATAFGGAASFGAGVDFASEAMAKEGMGAVAGQSGVKDFFAQAFDNAKQDASALIDRNVVRDAAGDVDGWKTAGNMGYNGAKTLIAKAASGGGGGGDREDTPQKIDAPAPTQAQAVAPDAEAELNKLRNRMNA